MGGAVVAVTRLRLRSRGVLPAFALAAWAAARQAVRAPGFLGGRLLWDAGWTFWTLTAWSGEAAMRRYRSSGAHGRILPLLARWCDEAAFAHWHHGGAELPGWDEAAARLAAGGHWPPLPHASAGQRARRFPPPRRGRELTLRPRPGAAAIPQEGR